jgi:hypothetical protein
MTRAWRRSTWAIPVLLGLASTIGLVAALTGDGARDLLSWLTLAMPVVAITWAWLARR